MLCMLMSAHECRNVKNKQYDDEVCLRIKGITLFEHETFQVARRAQTRREDQAVVCEDGEAGRRSRLHRVSAVGGFGIFVAHQVLTQIMSSIPAFRVAGYKSYELYCRWLSGKLSETVEITAIQNSTYPAITFCPQAS